MYFIRLFIAFFLSVSTIPQLLSQSSVDSVSNALIGLIAKEKKNDNIIFIGEQNHSTKEQFKTSFNLIKYLVDNQGYKILMSESYFIDTFIALKKGLHFPVNTISPIYKLSEEYKLLVSLDTLIEHVGFDCQMKLSIDNVEFLSDYFNLHGDVRSVFEDGLLLLSSRKPGSSEFELTIQNLINKNTSELDRLALENILVYSRFRSIESEYSNKWKPKYGNLRDKMMANNALFWYKYFKNEKFIALGASTHFAYGFTSLDNDDLHEYNVMGSYFKEWKDQLNQPILNIAFSSGQGWRRPVTTYQIEEFQSTIGTIESNVINSNSSFRIIDLSTKENFNSTAIDSISIGGNYGEVWDLLVVFANATGNERLKTEGKIIKNVLFQKNQILDAQSLNPVSYANILIEGLQEGTNSNSEGIFSINNNSRYEGHNIIISSIGYYNKTMKSSALKAGDTIYLQPSVTILNDIEITAKAETPLSILSEMIEKIDNESNSKHINYFEINSKVLDSSDTLHISTINEVTLLNEKTFALNILGVRPFNKKNFNKLGFYVSYPWRGLLQSHYYFSPIYITSKLQYFELSFDKERSGKEGIVINFKATKLSFKVLHLSDVSSYEGTIWLNESYAPQKLIINISFETNDTFSIISQYKWIDKELIPVFVIENSTIKDKKITSISNWLKSIPYIDQPLIMNYDLISIEPSKKVFDTYNRFILEANDNSN